MYFPSSRKVTRLDELNHNSKEDFIDDFVYSELTVDRLKELYKDRKLTCHRLVSMYLERIRRLNSKLYAVLEINENVLKEAKECDLLIKKGVSLPLLGVPVLLKDNIEASGMHNTAGSMALSSMTVTEDAPLVKKLKAAGAVILGKTNMSEWAFYRSSSGISGWSAKGGRVRNPYVLDRSTYGSSSGSACAVSSNLCVLAVGTETDGSIVGPASLCGIVGIKPTHGLVEGDGIIPLSHSFDTPGPMARTVKDAALMLETLSLGHEKSKSLIADLKVTDFKNMKIGVIQNELTSKAHLIRVLDKALEVFTQNGALIEQIDFGDTSAWREAELGAFRYEFKKDLNAYLSKRSYDCKTLSDVIAFNLEHKREELTFFDQDLLEAADSCTLSDEEGEALVKKAKELAGPLGIDRIMDEHNLDIIVGIETVPAWVCDYVNSDPEHEVSGSIAAVSGYPSICLPAGDVSGLPVGLVFIGRKYSEDSLIRTAYSFEQLSKKRIVPKFYKTLKFHGA